MRLSGRIEVSAHAVGLVVLTLAVSPMPANAQSPAPRKGLDDIIKEERLKPAPRQADRDDAQAVVARLRPCWAPSTGVGTKAVAVEIEGSVDDTGRVTFATPVDHLRVAQDQAFKAAAYAALRAVLNPRCQPWPIRNKTFRFTFAPT